MKDEQPGAKYLSEEETHNRYSVDSAMKHYENVVYYNQRGGGDWFQGRVSQAYRDNYDKIFKKEKENEI